MNPGAAFLGVLLIAQSVTLDRALTVRRSVREFAPAAVRLDDVKQLLWAAQGITSSDGRRTAPSAGALYPIEIYVVAGNVEKLPAGVYHYDARKAALDLVASGDRRAALSGAAFGQQSVATAPAAIVIAAVYARTASKYGTRAERYCAIEAGCVSQNISLEAVSRGLGTVVVGAFSDGRVAEVVSMKAGETPLVIMPVGKGGSQ